MTDVVGLTLLDKLRVETREATHRTVRVPGRSEGTYRWEHEPNGCELGAVVALVEAAQKYLDAHRAMYEALDAHSKGMEDRRGFCHGQEDAALHKLSFALAPFVGEATQ